MAKQREIQYVNAYVSGSMAYQMEMPERKKTVKLPKQARQKAPQRNVDARYVCCIVGACLLIVMMIQGFVMLTNARREAGAMAAWGESLQAENQVLQDTYASSYDRVEAEAMAKTVGLVPVEQVETIMLEVSVPQLREEPTAWQAFCTFLAGLFA